MGSGFRVWTAGEVVSASNVNNYLQEQTVMSFAGTAARSSAISAPEEGMLSYLQDSDVYQGYDGSAWVNLGTLSGASDAGLVHIDTTSFSAVASQSVNNVFTSTYRNYKIVLQLTGNQNAATTLAIRLRASGSDLTSGYAGANKFAPYNTNLGFDVATSPTDRWNIGYIPFGTDGHFGGSLDMCNPAEANHKTLTGITAGTRTGLYLGFGISGGTLKSVTLYDGLTVLPSAGTITGTIQVFGYKE